MGGGLLGAKVEGRRSKVEGRRLQTAERHGSRGGRESKNFRPSTLRPLALHRHFPQTSPKRSNQSSRSLFSSKTSRPPSPRAMDTEEAEESRSIRCAFTLADTSDVNRRGLVPFTKTLRSNLRFEQTFPGGVARRLGRFNRALWNKFDRVVKFGRRALEDQFIFPAVLVGLDFGDLR
jgi:hypothetical protein